MARVHSACSIQRVSLVYKIVGCHRLRAILEYCGYRYTTDELKIIL